jgi:hypothetical protein
VVQTTTNLQSPILWTNYVTNRAINSILSATNQMTVPYRFFRARLGP